MDDELTGLLEQLKGGQMSRRDFIYKSGGEWNEAHDSNPKLDALIDAVGSELESPGEQQEVKP